MADNAAERIAYKPFAVYDEAYCTWEWDLPERNLQYLRSIDPVYFEYVAEANKEGLKSVHKQRAAVAIRTGYHHGLETLFALLFAALQAPGCVVGWMHKYKNEQLRALVRSVDGTEVPRYLAVTPDPYTWEGVSNVVFSLVNGDTEKIEQEIANFGGLWRRFATDFLAQNHIDEYNSIKHGLRMISGATSIHVALQEGPGVPASIEDAERLSGGEFGSSIFVPKEITKPDGSRLPKERRGNFTIGQSALNWEAENLCEDLELISTSIHNVRTYLLTANRAPGPPLDYQSRETEAFQRKRTSNLEVTSFMTDPNVTERDIETFTKEQILAFYEQWRNS